MAGMGEVGMAMRWVLWGDESDLIRDENGDGVWLKGEKTREGSKDVSTDEGSGDEGDGDGISMDDYMDSDIGLDTDTDATEDDGDPSEAEWEGWIYDLERQKRVQRLYQASGHHRRFDSLTQRDRDVRRAFAPMATVSALGPLSSVPGLGSLSPVSAQGPLFTLVSQGPLFAAQVQGPSSLPSSPDSLHSQPDTYFHGRPRALTASPPSSTVSLERSASGVMRDGGVFVPRPSSPFAIDEPFVSIESGIGRHRLPGSTVTSTVSVGTAGKGKGRALWTRDKEDERKVRPRSATITASGMTARFLKKNKAKDEELDNTSGDNQNASGTKEKTLDGDDKDRDKKDKAGSKLKKSERRPQLSLTFSPPPSIPYSLPTPTTSDFVESARTPTAERPRVSLVRHVRSGSSLRVGSGEERSNHDGQASAEDFEAVTGSGKKKKPGMGIVKGVSVRAERFMRGFDSALDFVDGR
jgi:hypothetical protein